MNPKALLAAAAWLAASPAYADINWTPAHDADVRARIADGEFGAVTSLLVLHDGALVFEGYFNDANAETLHDTRSVTKTITGQLVGVAIDEGLLALDEPLAPLFEDAQPFAHDDPRKQALTAHDLLTMSGPLECDDWNSFSRGNEERMYIVEDWTGFFWDLPARGFPAWATPPADTTYGRAFSYCTAGVQVLGEAVARVSGRDIRDYAQDRLFGPLGVTDYEWPLNASGAPHLGGGLRLSTRALAAFGELQRNAGRHGGRQLFSEEWARLSVTPQAEVGQGTQYEYGLLWWLEERESAAGAVQVALMNGNGGNRVWVIEELGLTIVLTKTDYNSQSMHQQARNLFQSLIAPALTR
jgi:CubicO group peptidase (beta-lactamase class C family)